jgi:hypothetical protein
MKVKMDEITSAKVCMQTMSGAESNATSPGFRAKSGDFGFQADNLW